MRFPTSLAVALGSIATILAAPAPAGAVASDPAEVLTIAHRGARHVAPENTLAALRAGIERGADMVEIDVQRTKDGRLVLMHDRDLVRTTNVEKVFPKKKSYDVADLTWAEVRKLDAGAWKRAKFAGERVPTLKQAIRLVYRERAGLLVEIKSPRLYPGIESKVSNALRGVDGYLGWALGNDKLTVQSFDYDAAELFKEMEPRVPVALLGTPAVADLPALARWADEVSARHKTIDERYVSAVHAMGMDCTVWTVDNEDNMNASLDKGVDGVVTNKPITLDRILQQRAAQ
jgi:glycerophosphoryl diester phosphodiesterase